MPAKHELMPRSGKPEREQDYNRSAALGYEDTQGLGIVPCLSHGYPTPLARWHYHDEYELHLITSTTGKVFVGDWIGHFHPGQLVLTGPRLPHNWVSTDTPEGGVPERDLVIQFPHEPLVASAKLIPEMGGLLPMLERAKYGIEFFEFGERGRRHWEQVKSAQGLQRLAAFYAFLSELAVHTDYRLLSSVQLPSDDDDASLNRIEDMFESIMNNLGEDISAADMAASMDMSESQFSRYFKKATGNTFTDFVNRLRINRACQLLMETDQLVAAICYEVGFNNVANFNRRFMDIKGMTPTEFRRQSRTRFKGAE